MLCCGFWWSGLTVFFFQHVFSLEKSRRCYDNQQITVSHFGEHKRLHLESSKQNYYIISLRAIIKAIFTSLHQATARWPDLQRRVNTHIQAEMISQKGGEESWEGTWMRQNAATSRTGYSISTKSRFEKVDNQFSRIYSNLKNRRITDSISSTHTQRSDGWCITW